MQLGIAQRLRLEADCLFVEMRAGVFLRAILEIVAECRVAGGMVHVTRIVDAQPLVQSVSVRVLKRRDRKMGVRPLSKPAAGTDRADDASRLVGMLAGADHHRSVAAYYISRREVAARARARIEFLAS